MARRQFPILQDRANRLEGVLPDTYVKFQKLDFSTFSSPHVFAQCIRCYHRIELDSTQSHTQQGIHESCQRRGRGWQGRVEHYLLAHREHHRDDNPSPVSSLFALFMISPFVLQGSYWAINPEVDSATSTDSAASTTAGATTAYSDQHAHKSKITAKKDKATKRNVSE
jgi:hypothetical protein